MPEKRQNYALERFLFKFWAVQKYILRVGFLWKKTNILLITESRTFAHYLRKLVFLTAFYAHHAH